MGKLSAEFSPMSQLDLVFNYIIVVVVNLPTGTLDMPPKCNHYQANASNLNPWRGGHDSPR